MAVLNPGGCVTIGAWGAIPGLADPSKLLLPLSHRT